MLKPIIKFFVALNGNIRKSQIAAGIAWGVLLGLVPASNFFGIVLFIVSFFFTHNHGAKILALALLKLCSPLIAPLIDSIGWQVLHIEALQPLFTTMYNMPFVPFTNFNNTLVAGGLAGGVILWLPVFFIFMGLILLYRNTLSPKIRNTKLVKFLVKLPFLSIIDKAIKS